jgi:hypothetical protein
MRCALLTLSPGLVMPSPHPSDLKTSKPHRSFRLNPYLLILILLLLLILLG